MTLRGLHFRIYSVFATLFESWETQSNNNVYKLRKLFYVKYLNMEKLIIKV